MVLTHQKLPKREGQRKSIGDFGNIFQFQNRSISIAANHNFTKIIFRIRLTQTASNTSPLLVLTAQRVNPMMKNE